MVPDPPPITDILRDRPPVRIQRRRIKGWRMPEGAVYVGRSTRWGNDLRPTMADLNDRPLGPERAVELYRLAILRWIEAGHDGLPGAEHLRREYAGWIDPLRGHDLVCWCPLDQPCHADVLLELAKP